MPDSPNVQNYMYGSGSCYIKLDTDVTRRHVGNVPELTLAKEITKETHKQAMSGLRSVDFEFITEVAATINATLEEVTPENMALFVMGTAAENTDGNMEIGGLSLTEIQADFTYESDNPNGRQIQYLARVSITPNGEFNFITEGLTSIPLQMTVLKNNGVFGTTIFIGGETD
jgi:hypothetical protein